MEIHTPDHPPATWNETIKHLAMITAGVLIALAFEGAVAWGDHRLLVREARANITEEIRSNRNELQGSLFKNVERQEKEVEALDRVAKEMLASKTSSTRELALSWNFAELKNAAVTTGTITGAFGYMRYDEVKRFAAVYDLQAQFMRSQERLIQDFQIVFAFIRRLADSPPPSAASLEEWRGRLSSLLAGLGLQEEVGRQLAKRYDEVLATSSR